jgi:hypothetical protein
VLDLNELHNKPGVMILLVLVIIACLGYLFHLKKESPTTEFDHVNASNPLWIFIPTILLLFAMAVWLWQIEVPRPSATLTTNFSLDARAWQMLSNAQVGTLVTSKDDTSGKEYVSAMIIAKQIHMANEWSTVLEVRVFDINGQELTSSAKHQFLLDESGMKKTLGTIVSLNPFDGTYSNKEAACVFFKKANIVSACK